MADRREDILNQEHRKFVKEKGISSIYPNSFPEAYKDAAINAMDENGKRMCLELLEYMAKKQVKCSVFPDGHIEFLVKMEVNWDILTKEQLFENFL